MTLWGCLRRLFVRGNRRLWFSQKYRAWNIIYIWGRPRGLDCLRILGLCHWGNNFFGGWQVISSVIWVNRWMGLVFWRILIFGVSVRWLFWWRWVVFFVYFQTDWAFLYFFLFLFLLILVASCNPKVGLYLMGWGWLFCSTCFWCKCRSCY
mgnify:CR=1 FL=1